MSMVAPWMLAGLLSLALIVWLHMRRRNQITVAFPAVHLLARITLRKSARLRFRSNLIFILRMLAVTALVLAMTLPAFTVYRPGGIRSGAAIAQVIILDDSGSTGQRGLDEPARFGELRDMAIAELGRLRSGDTSAIVLMGQPPRALQERVTHDLESLSLSLSTVTPSFRANAADDAIRLARTLLEKSRAPQKEILIITDHCGPEVDPTLRKSLSESLRVVGLPPKSTPFNLSISSLRVIPSGESDPLEAVIDATIVNHSGKAVAGVEAVLYLDGREAARGKIDVAAGATVHKAFHHRFATEGVHRGAVQIPADGLPADNTRYVTFEVRRALKIHIINGDFRPGSWEDEAFYLQKALATPMAAEVPLQITMTDVAGAADMSFVSYDAVLLAGVDRPPAPMVDRLSDFVREGGGVLISPGSQGGTMDALNGMLPGSVRAVRRDESLHRSFRVGALDREHPVFSRLKGTHTGLEDVRIEAHLLMAPGTTVERHILAELSDGMPLLMERKLGKGKIILLGTTLDRAWTDLPIRPGFLPLVQSVARYLAGRVGQDSPREREVGNTMSLEVNERMQRLVVVHPDNSETVFSARDLDGRARVSFDRTAQPGSYRVWTEMPGFGGLSELSGAEFVVNMSPAESDLSRQDEAQIADNKSEEKTYQQVAGKLPLWPWLLLAGILFLISESFVAGYGLRRSHVGRK